MGRIKDLRGQKFGRLTPLRDSGQRSSGRHVLWECQCECGNTCLADGVDLQRGKKISCGCALEDARRRNIAICREKAPTPNVIDYTGYRSGKLVAISPTEKRTSGGNVIWLCKCDCGGTIEVSTSDLKTKNCQSCGCLQSRSIGEMNIANILDANNIRYKRQYKFKDCLSPKGAPLLFDFAILSADGSLSYLIEFDGDQHYKPVELFGGEPAFDYQHKCDLIKNQYCVAHGISLLRIPFSKRDNMTLEDLRVKGEK